MEVCLPWLHNIAFMRMYCTAVKTMLNAAPASSVDLSEIYNYTDILCVNETEVGNRASCWHYPRLVV